MKNEDWVTVSYEKEAKKHDNQLECISWMRSQVKLKKKKRQVSYKGPYWDKLQNQITLTVYSITVLYQG